MVCRSLIREYASQLEVVLGLLASQCPSERKRIPPLPDQNRFWEIRVMYRYPWRRRCTRAQHQANRARLFMQYYGSTLVHFPQKWAGLGKVASAFFTLSTAHGRK
jgi:hypothetical protein